MKRGIRKLVSTVLVASMVLTCAATSALAAEPDSVQEFRQGKTKMISADLAIVVVQEDGTLWGWGRVENGLLGSKIGYDKEEARNKTVQFRTYPVKIMTDVAFANTSDLGTTVVKNDGSVWYTGVATGIDTMGARVTATRYQQDFTKLADNAEEAYIASNGIYVITKNRELLFYEQKDIRDFGPDDTSLTHTPNEPGSNHFEIAETPKKMFDNVVKYDERSGCNFILQDDGNVWVWGVNYINYPGDGTNSDEWDIKEPVNIFKDAKDVSANSQYIAIVKNDNSLWAWGTLPDADSLEPTATAQPTKIADNVKKAGGSNLSAILKNDGSLWAWGSWWTIDRKEETELRPTDFTDISDMYIDSQTMYLVKSDGSLWAFGNATNCEFGMPVESLVVKSPIQLTGFSATIPTVSAQTATATPTASKVLVNGKEISFDAYEISGNNYFKLRDIANAVSGTGKQFEVTWDSSKNAINLLSGKVYTTVGGELAKGDGSQKTAALNASKVYLDDKEISLTAYTINDNNYFKLRDLGQTFNFGVGWDGAANTVTIDTSTGYTAE